jgi:DNA-binding MarR family transcriptional regulator
MEEQCMSRDSSEKPVEVNREFVRELHQFTGLVASVFRATAARIGLAVTDLQVMSILDLTGAASAGELAELTGLTTGAITRILNRLEEAKLVRRERDPVDGRKVVVRLESGKDDLRRVRSTVDFALKAWDEVASHYDDEQIVFLLEFLKLSNVLSRREIARLQEALPGEGGIFSAPLEDQASGRLVVYCGISRLAVSASEGSAELYQARFEGVIPDVKAKEGVVTIRYPRRLLGLGGKQGAAEVALSVAIPWRIVIQGGASEVVAELGGLDLAGLEVKGGFSMIRLDLPAPSGVVPIRIVGGAPEITIGRPAGVAARVHLKGWVSELIFDDQTWSGAANNVRLQNSGFDPTVPRYDLQVTSYATRIIITSG